MTLTPDEWTDVAVGGALLGNNAIWDVAVSHAAALSDARLRRLEKAARASIDSERDALLSVLQKLQVKQTSETRANGDADKWFSRLFKKR